MGLEKLRQVTDSIINVNVFEIRCVQATEGNNLRPLPRNALLHKYSLASFIAMFIRLCKILYVVIMSFQVETV